MPTISFAPARALAFACGLLIIAAVPEAAATTPGGEPSADRGKAPKFASRALIDPADWVPLREKRPASRVAQLTKTGRVIAPEGAPRSVRRMIRAANRIAHKPYVYGGGHGSWEAAGYDCSGSVGYALHAAKLLETSVTSGALASFGHAGRGRWVTVYANGGHTYMVIAGLRFDTSSHGVDNSRWTREQRSPAGYVERHPAGL